MRRVSSDADALIDRLGLRPHPEGGWYAETWRAEAGVDGRATSTGIYFLLRDGERSHWHTCDADEIWVFHDGDPLELSCSPDGATVQRTVLGVDLAAGQRPQIVVPAGQWQAAASQGSWTLVSCVVAPGFEFEGFVLAPPGWEPGEG